jgi:hypothetical protein
VKQKRHHLPTDSRINVPGGQQISHTNGAQHRATRNFRIARVRRTRERLRSNGCIESELLRSKANRNRPAVRFRYSTNVIQEQSHQGCQRGSEHQRYIHVVARPWQCPTRVARRKQFIEHSAHGRSQASAKHVPTACHYLRAICECGRTRPSVRRHGMAEPRKRSGVECATRHSLRSAARMCQS